LILNFFLPDAGIFLPVKLRSRNRTIRECDVREAFPLAPPTFSIEFTQSRKLADAAANRECLYVRFVAADLEKH
jgi:hypothetical protein